MRQRLCALVVAAIFAFMATGCGDEMEVNGTIYPTYGLLNENEVKDPDVRYRTITGNVVWGIILCETLVAPVYFFGFSLYEPVGFKPKKDKQENK